MENIKSARRKTDTKNLTLLSMLVGLQAVLTFTPLGFLQIPPISITLMHVPVIVGAVILGVKAGAVLGGCFGIFSIVRAVASGSAMDILFNPFASGNFWYTVTMAVLPRILLGVIVALIYHNVAGKIGQSKGIVLAAVIGSICHSAGVLGLLSIFFSAFPLIDVLLYIMGVNGLAELTVGVVLSLSICKALAKTNFMTSK